ncbi:MAG: DNRLRE domain-containing protein [Candidatus Thorarchaeota archaeon]
MPFITNPEWKTTSRQMTVPAWSLTECDANVVANSPDTNFGTGNILELHRNVSEGIEVAIFLKFNLTSVSPSDGIVEAMLSLHKYYPAFPESPSLSIGAYWCSDNNWSEETITWNNAPWSSVSSQPVDTIVSSDVTPTLDITSAVIQAIDSRNVTIVIKAEEEGIRYFYAHEGVYPGSGNAQIAVRYIPGGATEGINTGAEYESGYIDEGFWYTWINLGTVQLIYITGVNPEYSTYFPSFHFLGQHFTAPDGNELLIGHLLLVYELFDDANQNGILDADYDLGFAETSYYLDLNISTGFTPTPVQKILVDGVWHYNWSLRHEDVWGFLKFPEGPIVGIGDTAGVVWLDYLEYSYDYFIQDNVTHLKTDLALGPVIDFDNFTVGVTYTGLGLTALHSTILLASSGTPRVVINSTEYDSQRDPTLEMTNATISGTAVDYYDLLFDQNYTLYTTPPNTLPAPSAACPSSSVHPHVHSVQYREPFNAFRGFLATLLPQISDLTLAIDYNFENSSLIYRVNYPQWDGYALEHDPLYIAFLSGRPIIPHHPPPPPYLTALLWSILITAIATFGVIVLTLSLFELRRIKTRNKETQ